MLGAENEAYGVSEVYTPLSGLWGRTESDRTKATSQQQQE